MEGKGASVSLPPAPVTPKEEKNRKKDPKHWHNVAKSIEGLEVPGKLSALESKYKELYNENRELAKTNQQLLKQITALQKEKDHKEAEHTKSVMARSRVEGVCRELQKQNKKIKEENLAKIKEEEERRKEVSLKFAQKLNDINVMMDENKDKSEKLREENFKMTGKLAELYAQFQRREEDIDKMSKQLELEREFSQTTLKKMELEFLAEKEIYAKEQTLLKSNLEKSEANCCVLLETVKGLQDHIDVYKNQYEDFESTMTKSSNVFDKFKSEIATMTKQVNALEQEAQSWKKKFQDSMKALVEVSELKKNQESYLQTLDKKNDQLHKLCRQLQVERTTYLKQLKSHGIDVGPAAKEAPLGEEEAPPKVSTGKITKKEKELQALKENLKAVQEQLTRINVEEKPDAVKTETPTSQGPKAGSKGAKARDSKKGLPNLGSQTVITKQVVSTDEEEVPTKEISHLEEEVPTTDYVTKDVTRVKSEEIPTKDTNTGIPD